MSARKDTQIEGQLSIFEFCLDSSNYVVQANELIVGKQTLSINAAKLLRSAIMQIKPEDEELKPYIVSIPEMAKLLKIPRQDLNRDIDKITDEILRNPVLIKNETKGKIQWVKFSWVKTCKYDSEKGIYITLNDDLKPFLVNLKEKYAQYSLDDILTMKSVYAIRIYELLQAHNMRKVLPKDGVIIELTIDEIRTACDCVEKFKSFSSFREKVIKKAMDEINEKTMYKVEYADIRKGHKIVGFQFKMNMKYH